MWQYYYAGESHLVVELGSTIDLSINSDVHALAGALVALQPRGLREVVPSYRSLMISYDPLVITAPELRAICQGLMKSKAICRPHQREMLEIPVRYGGELGPDLDQVAEETSLTVEEVVAMHVRRAYAVYMIGFLPGFPYLGGLDPRLSLPRLKVPRTKVPAGSVAIADLQTGVYPLSSPGGWRIIGRTPLRFFNIAESPPSLLRPGQWVRFRSVSGGEYAEIADLVKANRFRPRVVLMDAEHA
ncbi:MAG: Kinase A inhibitor [Firmicutes bacterium]|nr:Kinase A inhibitor [Bacillota bacterium]